MPIGPGEHIDAIYRDLLEQEFARRCRLQGEFEADWFGGRWSGLSKPADPETARRNVPTGISKKLFDSLGPHADHRTRNASTSTRPLGRVLEAKKTMFTSR